MGKLRGAAVTLAAVTLGIAGLAVLGVPTAAEAELLQPCAKPTISAPAYAKGSTNTIAWTLSGIQGSGFIAEVSLSADFSQTEQSVGDIGAAATGYSFTGLSEAEHYYHVRTKTLPGVCSASDWSTPVSTIQDSTPPVVTVASPQDGAPETGSTLTVAGTLADPSGGAAPSGSGPASVSVTVTNSASGSQTTQSQQTSGPWSVTFSSVPRGVYVVSVTGEDQVGNTGTAPPRLVFVVDAAPLASPATALIGTIEALSSAGSAYEVTTIVLAGTYQGQLVGPTSYDCLSSSAGPYLPSGMYCAAAGGVNSVVQVPDLGGGVLPSEFSLSFTVDEGAAVDPEYTTLYNYFCPGATPGGPTGVGAWAAVGTSPQLPGVVITTTGAITGTCGSSYPYPGSYGTDWTGYGVINADGL